MPDLASDRASTRRGSPRGWPPASTRSPTATCPPWNGSSPLMQRSSVLLPPPDGPMMRRHLAALDRQATRRAAPRSVAVALDAGRATSIMPATPSPEAELDAAEPRAEQRVAHRRYSTAVMTPELEVACGAVVTGSRYCLVSSMMVITEQTDVSLNSAMKSLVTGGITMRTACGTMIAPQRQRAATCQRERRLHLPASGSPATRRGRSPPRRPSS